MYYSSYMIYYAMGIILIPAFILSAVAQFKVFSTFSKYDKSSTNYLTASEIARRLLDASGLYDIQIKRVDGHLTDNYNYKTKTLSLSSTTCNSNTISSIGVACHEIGHCLQYKDNYFPLKLRNFIIPIVSFVSKMLLPILIIGFIFDFLIATPFGAVIMWAGVIVYGLSTLISLITLPVEYNASKRAYKLMLSTGALSQDECNKAKEVLDAAALTYVAELVTSLLFLLRFVIVLFLRNKD